MPLSPDLIPGLTGPFGVPKHQPNARAQVDYDIGNFVKELIGKGYSELEALKIALKGKPAQDIELPREAPLPGHKDMPQSSGPMMMGAPAPPSMEQLLLQQKMNGGQ